MMTAYSSLVIKMGSLTRILLMVNTAVTAPFVGLCILAVLFPFVHCKGAGISTLLMVVYQLWHMAGVIKTGTGARRLPVSTEYCTANQSTFLSPSVSSTAPSLQTEEPFFVFRLSYFWSSFFSFIGTIVLAVIISAVTGETEFDYLCRMSSPRARAPVPFFVTTLGHECERAELATAPLVVVRAVSRWTVSTPLELGSGIGQKFLW
ncbi:uncharacterized protein LOC125759124 [Rhipicephalus sanguineus]|uniref:uncharacterized protein LOC125759124 n=1 Tax=Rhipicephalus sanguineus TaxID=34632 RepID=UPI0020C31EEE|nr:uncharacterized protein LOC125759124 [Rhipicephalus sanguineus]